MPKVIVTNLATRDSVFSVIGRRVDIAAYVMNAQDTEYLSFGLLGNGNGYTTCNVLNIPREIVMIGSEHEVEADEQGNVKSVTDAQPATSTRVSLD